MRVLAGVGAAAPVVAGLSTAATAGAAPVSTARQANPAGDLARAAVAVHGRNGIFDNGASSFNRVHYGNGYVNAFWDGTKMTYGDGDGVEFGALVEFFAASPNDPGDYLLAEGSGAKTIGGVTHSSTTCDGSTVAGIGRDAAGAIWYRALTVYMTSSTTNSGARTATLNAARDLYGAGSAQFNAVAAAWTGMLVA